MLIGYARVSTQAQSLDRQLGALNAARVDRIFREKATAKTVKGRPQLEKQSILLAPMMCSLSLSGIVPHVP